MSVTEVRGDADADLDELRSAGMKTVPRRLLLLGGGGPIGVEMAQSVLDDDAGAARRKGDEYILNLDDGNQLSSDQLLGRHGPSVPHREPRPRNGWRGG
jgi:hypothetical protein